MMMKYAIYLAEHYDTLSTESLEEIFSQNFKTQKIGLKLIRSHDNITLLTSSLIKRLN